MNKWFQNLKHWIFLELIWTITPVLILLLLGLPSIKILYRRELSNFSRSINIKVIGHQWYWEYSFPEFMVSFNSYPKMLINIFRLGERDVLIVPFKRRIRILLSSEDVIHAWAIPSANLKIDATPGRLNFMNLYFYLGGKHIGQCSELCGNYHSWIPIYLEVTSSGLFREWLKVINN